MPLSDRIHAHFADAIQTAHVAASLAPEIEAAAQALVACLAGGGKVLVCGCGGSAANGQHFVARMVGRYEHERPGLAALALGGHAALLSALANDQGFEHAYARELKACGQPGDTLLAISALGLSPAVLHAVEAARARAMPVIALTGKRGGALAEQSTDTDLLICVPSESVAHIHETHLLILHALCDAVDSVLLGVE